MPTEIHSDTLNNERPGTWSGTAISGFILSILGIIVPFGSIASVVLSGLGLAFTSQGRKRGRALAGWGLALGIANAGIGAIIGGIGMPAVMDSFSSVTNSTSTSSSANSVDLTETFSPIADGRYQCGSVSDVSDVVVEVHSGKVRAVLTTFIDGPVELEAINMDQQSDTSFSVAISNVQTGSFLGTFLCD